jgi:predicted dehydrogenase
MVTARDKSGKILQVGHQRHYSELYHSAISLVDQGVLGDVYHIRALWHRNSDWSRKVPDAPFDPSRWGYPDMQHLINWRFYRKYSHGLMAELGSHQIDVANWVFGGAPHAVLASGGTYCYRDGREVEDHIYAIFEYANGRTLTYSSIQTNKLDHYYEQIMGTKGTLILQGEGEAYLFSEEDKEPKATEIKIETNQAGAPVMEASASRAADAAGGSSAASTTMFNRLIAYRQELTGFAHSVHSGEPPLCTAEIARDVALAAMAGNASIQQKRRIEIGDFAQA